ncbi:uncharacterized protein SPSK_10548 [Sporothrix schenckii 1099-18]|uniref:Uncharacterized protein n=1 Tax=Sporothrix schenckii 1099-18 TaxID=1397361 RepID=A0A0F2LYL0_SPOSC|nr:uncharacterized protein SPSK_10548 [Sporothrix schenckii 1099-18]KJR82557.1 hypothetical protein SPSK_10548 [Sporothrix schenckii 1099-18]
MPWQDSNGQPQRHSGQLHRAPRLLCTVLPSRPCRAALRNPQNEERNSHCLTVRPHLLIAHAWANSNTPPVMH